MEEGGHWPRNVGGPLAAGKANGFFPRGSRKESSLPSSLNFVQCCMPDPPNCQIILMFVLCPESVVICYSSKTEQYT